jgi:hypothetical protein
MQDETIRNILSYLSSKELEGFTGGVKMGFENGKPQSFSETFCPDKEIIAVDALFDLESFIRDACKPGFHGTLYIVYKSGILTHYNRVRTMQGQVLERVLGSRDIPMRPKKCVVKMGVRTSNA